MKCPNCIAVDLLMTERQGIEIDYCPTCRGVWLDRGELDRFIQKADQYQSSLPRNMNAAHNELQPYDGGGYTARYDDRRGDDRDSHYDNRHDKRYESYRGKKKESFWSEIFDFD